MRSIGGLKMDENIKALYETILKRKTEGEEGSYTKYLFEKGTNKILKKVGEECTEVIISCKENNKEEQINEICDLTYHLLVLMAQMNISIEEVGAELEKRRNKINNFKGERKPITNV
jgi:phosphoribosyl-ATP pyrophosphatase (EC 3.6.1.31)